MKIHYPSGPVCKAISGDLDPKIVRGVATNERMSVINAEWESKDLRGKLLRKVEKDINSEIKGLSSRRNPSLLADTTPNNIINIKDSSVASELKDRTPTMERLLRAVVCVKTKGSGHRKDTKKDHKIARAVSMATSVLLRCRNPAMSAMSYRVSLLLWRGGAEKQVIYLPMNTSTR